MMKEGYAVTDNLELLVHRDGKLVDRRVTLPKTCSPFYKAFVRVAKLFGFCKEWADDDIVNQGLVDIADMIGDRYTYVSMGTSTTPVNVATDVQLGNQVQTRVVATKSIVTTTIANDTAQFSGQFTLSGDAAITECGLQKDSTYSGSDIMLCRQVFAALNLRTGDVVTFVWKIQVSRSA
ncbi:MAG: hypothetical protein M0P69_16125 [Bacteroidales bacterium]|nr:hypothetical protein [Bacteroidales bacterium]